MTVEAWSLPLVTGKQSVRATQSHLERNRTELYIFWKIGHFTNIAVGYQTIAMMCYLYNNQIKCLWIGARFWPHFDISIFWYLINAIFPPLFGWNRLKVNCIISQPICWKFSSDAGFTFYLWTIRLNLFYKWNGCCWYRHAWREWNKTSHYEMVSNTLLHASIKLCITVVSFPLREREEPGSIPPGVKEFFSCLIFF